MSYDIQQSTTAFPLLFLLVQSSDHVTPLTGATPTVTLSKNGGTFASPSGAVTEIANGVYKVAGNATDSNTLGPLWLHATAASGDPTDVVFPVVAFNPQDAVHLGLSALPNAAAGASDGIPINGSNSGTMTLAALTITGSFIVSDGFLVSRSTLNASGATFTGNGTGSGAIFQSGAGLTGDGIQATAASSSGNGISALGVGGKAGILATGTGSGASGMLLQGASTGNGLFAQGGNGAAMQGAIGGSGLVIQGNAGGAGMTVTGGNSGNGLAISGGLTSGAGISITTASGDGVSILPTVGNAIVATANGTSKHGIVVTGGTGGTSDGLKAVAGTGGVPIRGNITGNLTGAVSGAVGSVTAAVVVDGTSPLTEVYPGKGGAFTLASALYGLSQRDDNMSISGTTLTVFKRDGTTVAQTFTLDSATAPTSISQAT